jgi:integrase
MAARKRERNRLPSELAEARPSAGALRSAVTVAEFASVWLATRDPRTRHGDEQRLRSHILPQLGGRRLREIVADDVSGVIRRTLGKKGIEVKSVKNAYATFAELLGAALAQGLLSQDPRELPADIWPVAAPAPRPSFSAAEVSALTLDERLDAELRIYNSLAFYTGVPSAQLCCWRFGDWREALGTPPAPELEATLLSWQQHGFERVFGRPPSPEDWLVPRRSDVAQPQSEGSLYKAFRRCCVALGIATRSPHALRNTFEKRLESGAGPAAPSQSSEALAARSD